VKNRKPILRVRQVIEAIATVGAALLFSYLILKPPW
jgi:hypothetical protein